MTREIFTYCMFFVCARARERLCLRQAGEKCPAANKVFQNNFAVWLFGQYYLIGLTTFNDYICWTVIRDRTRPFPYHIVDYLSAGEWHLYWLSQTWDLQYNPEVLQPTLPANFAIYVQIFFHVSEIVTPSKKVNCTFW